MNQKIFTLAAIFIFCLNIVTIHAQISNTSTSITLNQGSGFRQQVCPWNVSGLPPGPGTYTLTVSYVSQDVINIGNYGTTITTSPITVSVTNNINSQNNTGQIVITSSASIGIPTDVNDGYSLVTTEGTVTLTSGSFTWTQSWQYFQYKCDPLPLFLTGFSFDANYSNGSYFKLNWQTLDEHDVSHFVVQRSLDGHNFSDFVIEPAVGETTNFTNYSVYMNRPSMYSTHWSFYRLKIIDTDGSYEFSSILKKQNTGVSGTPPNNFCSFTYLEGPSTVTCNPATYKIHNAPGGTFNWSLSGSYGTVSSFNFGTQATVTPSTSSSGYGTLMVTPSGGCTKTLLLNLGFPEPSGNLWTSASQNVTLQSWNNGSNYIYENTTVHFSVQGATSASQYTVNGGNPYFNFSNYYPYEVDFNMDPGSFRSFAVSIPYNGCTKTFYYVFVAIENPNNCYYCSYYSVAPNPVSSDLTIYVDEEKLKKEKIEKSPDQVIEQVIITDKFGNTLLQQKYPLGTKKITMNISNLPTDIYVAKIFNGKKWVTIKVMKK